VYGIGCDDIVDRTKEIQWLIRLANLKLGPKLLGLFGNGRFEEYLDATTLTSHDIRDKPTSAAIAYRLSQLHSITSIYPNTKEESWEVWLMVDKWYHMLSTHLNHELSSKSASWAKILKEVDVARLGREIEECKTLLNSMKNKVVFAHNDVSFDPMALIPLINPISISRHNTVTF
jgi:thiamine kinase-like enzyme